MKTAIRCLLAAARSMTFTTRGVLLKSRLSLYVLNLERDFERDVVQPFVSSYLNGETPIPCVRVTVV